MRKIALFSCFVILLSGLKAYAKKDVFTLKDAVVQGVKASPILDAARHSVDALKAYLFKAEAAAWPRASMNTFIAPMPAQRGNPVNGETDLSKWGYFFYFGISGYVPIYTFGKISYLKDAARYGVKASGYAVDIARQASAHKIESVYIAAQIARDTLDALKEGEKYLNKAEKHLEELEKSDDPDFDPMDKARFIVYKNQYLTYRVQAESALKQALGALGELTGNLGIKHIEQLKAFDWKGQNPGYYIEQAMKLRPEVLALKEAVAAKMAQVGLAKAAFYPDLYVGGRFTYGKSNVADPQDSPFAYDPYNTYSAGGVLGLRMGLDIGGKIADLKKAKAELAQLKAKLRALKMGIKIEVKTRYQRILEAKKTLGYAKKAMEAARGWAIGEADLYDNGFASIKDVVDAVAQFYKMKFAYYKALGEFNLRVLELEHAVGICRYCKGGKR